MAADLGETLARVTEEAARLILPLFQSGLEVMEKADLSPVTVADQRAETLILGRLRDLFPDVVVVSEEHCSEHGVPLDAVERFFLVDPLDGTKGFLRHTPHWTVNIGLIEHGVPVAGAVCAPVTGEVWFTVPGGAAKRTGPDGEAARVHARAWPEGDALALVSHTLKDEQEAWLRGEYRYAHVDRMDSSVKFCRLAEGTADLYPRHGPTMEWDTAAADAVLRAAGGSVRTLDGQPLTYGKADKGWLNPSFVARGA